MALQCCWELTASALCWNPSGAMQDANIKANPATLESKRHRGEQKPRGGWTCSCLSLKAHLVSQGLHINQILFFTAFKGLEEQKDRLPFFMPDYMRIRQPPITHNNNVLLPQWWVYSIPETDRMLRSPKHPLPFRAHTHAPWIQLRAENLRAPEMDLLTLCARGYERGGGGHWVGTDTQT